VVQQDDAPQLPCVYFEIGIDGHAAGRLVFQVCVCVIEFPGDGWCSLAGFAWVYGNECVALAAALCVAWNRAGLWFGSVVPSLTSGCVSYPSFAVTLFRARLRTLSDCVREKQVLQASLPTIRLH
jgi:hypothetical protein